MARPVTKKRLSRKGALPKKPNLDALIDSAVDRASIDVQRLNAGPFNGLTGELPKWFPPILLGMFTAARGRLLNCYTPEVIQTFIRQLDEQDERTAALMVELDRIAESASDSDPPPDIDAGAIIWNPTIPLDAWDDVCTLRMAQAIITLGEEDGLKAWTGETGASLLRKAALARQNAALSAGRTRGVQAQKERAAANSAEISYAIQCAQSLGKTGVEAIVRAVIRRAATVRNGGTSDFFPNGVHYAESTIVRKIREMLSQRQKKRSSNP